MTIFSPPSGIYVACLGRRKVCFYFVFMGTVSHFHCFLTYLSFVHSFDSWCEYSFLIHQGWQKVVLIFVILLWSRTRQLVVWVFLPSVIDQDSSGEAFIVCRNFRRKKKYIKAPDGQLLRVGNWVRSVLVGSEKSTVADAERLATHWHPHLLVRFTLNANAVFLCVRLMCTNV